MCSSAKPGEGPGVKDVPADQVSPANPSAPPAAPETRDCLNSSPRREKFHLVYGISATVTFFSPSRIFRSRLGGLGGCLNDVLATWTDLITLPPIVLSNPSGNQTVSH